jgi:hypothetical protein
MWTLLLVAAGLAQMPRSPGPDPTAVFPPGTVISIRFPRSLEGGRDPVREPVEVQTMDPLLLGGCVVLPPFSRIAGAVTVSRGGGLFGRGGFLDLRFDSVATSAGTWVRLHAVLDSLEWPARGALRRGGALRPRARSVGGFLGATGVIGLAGALTEVGMIPIVAVAGWDMLQRGTRAHILTGERGALRLTAALVLPAPARCVPPAPPPIADLQPPPGVAPRAANRRGTADADPINLILRGSAAAVDSAFRRADWMRAAHSTFGALAQEAEAIVLSARDSAGPMSHEFLEGRIEDERFERASPSARSRHHVRLWRVDSSGTLWAAAATEDIGMLVSARHRTVTHRVAPDVDRERDLLVGDLLAGGCAVLEGYTTLPGALPGGTTVAGQRYFTDMKVAVMDVADCARPDSSGRSPD